MYPSDKEPIENLLGNRRSHFYDILSDFSVRFFQSSSFNANAKVKNVFFFHSCRDKRMFLSLCEIGVKKGGVWRVRERGQRSCMAAARRRRTCRARIANTPPASRVAQVTFSFHFNAVFCVR